MEFAEIQKRWPELEIVYRDEMTSTNDWAMARARAEEGSSGPILVITNQQSAGRGRRGNEWASRAGCDLTFSVMHRPDGKAQGWYRLALVAACAVLGALREAGLQAEVKWPNDLWIEQKKCAGILVETTGEWAVVGVGVNVNGTFDEPEEIKERTTLESQGGMPLERVDLLAAILERYFCLMNEETFAEVIEKISPHFALSGKKISFQVGAEARTGKVQGLGRRGGLLLESGEEVVQAHEVRLLD